MKTRQGKGQHSPRGLRIATLAVAIAAAGGTAHATDVFRLEGFGAISRGMGGVATAHDVGAAGMMTNPATLSLMPADNTAQVGLDLVTTDIDVTNRSTGEHVHSGDHSQNRGPYYAPQAALTRRVGQWTFGLGAFAQGGLGTEYGRSSFLSRATGGIDTGLENSSRLLVLNIPLAASFRASEALTIGGSVDAVWQGLNLNLLLGADQVGSLIGASRVSGSLLPVLGGLPDLRGAHFSLTRNSPLASGVNAWGYTGRIGMTYALTPATRLGAAYTTRSRMSDMEGRATLTAIDGVAGQIPLGGKIRIRDCMLGYARDEIVGVSLIELTAPCERGLTERNVHGLFDGDFPSYTVQKRYEKKEGGYLWANVSASRIPAMDEDGPMLAVIVEDITARMEAERSLAATRAELTRVARFTAMGELVASIAHEINQPLAAVITNSQAALRWLSHDEPNLVEVAAALQRANRDASLAGAVISRIRGFLRAGQIRRAPVDLARMLDEVLQMLQLMLTEAGVDPCVRLPDPPPRLIADAVQLQQVLINLIVNAVDAMREQSERARLLQIDVVADPAGGLRFSVRDNGPGVAAGSDARMFEAFFSTKPDGLGMGLAISRSIVENHGGRLWLARDGGPGACFEFTIPDN